MKKWTIIFIFLLLSACKQSTPKFNGYIDADLTYLSSDKGGRLAQLLVKRGELVKPQQLLFTLEQTSEQDEVSISHNDQRNLLAQKQQILAELQYAKIIYQRTAQMLRAKAASQNALDAAKKDLDVLKNQLDALEFQIKNSQINTAIKSWIVSRKEGIANSQGLIFDTYFTQDEYVQAGQPVLALITQQNIKAIFFVPETLLGKIKLNAKVNIMVDNGPGIEGSINYISNIAQYTPPIIYSREDRKKLVFRIETTIKTSDLQKIHLGQPVTVEVVS